MDTEGRKKFDVFYRELLLGKSSEYPVPEAVGKVEVLYPPDHNAFDYFYEAS